MEQQVLVDPPDECEGLCIGFPPNQRLPLMVSTIFLRITGVL